MEYTQDMTDFLISNSHNHTIRELHAMFCNKFGCDASVHGIRAKVRALGLTYKNPERVMSRAFGKEVAEFIRDNASGITNSQLARMVMDTFGVEITKGQVKSMKHYMGVRSGLNQGVAMRMSRPAGWVNPAKGRKVSSETYDKIRSRFFRKGENGLPPCPVGTERIRGGHVMVKVAEPSTWVSKARLVYEESTGETLGSKDVIMFLDGDRMNFNPDNLMRCTKTERLFRNVSAGRICPSELSKAIILTCRLRMVTQDGIHKKKQIQQQEGSDRRTEV